MRSQARFGLSWLIAWNVITATCTSSAAVVDYDFGNPSANPYQVTILDDGVSTIATQPAAAELEILGSIATGGEPALFVAPALRVRARKSWSIEARFQVDNALLSELSTRDTLEVWIVALHAEDPDDAWRAKWGLVKGPFTAAGFDVVDGYFVDAGYEFDTDSTPETGAGSEYFVIDPAAAPASGAGDATLRIAFDESSSTARASFAVGEAPFVDFAFAEGEVDPLSEWQLDANSSVAFELRFAGTRAAEGGPIQSNPSLDPGQIRFRSLEISGTPVPEPGGTLPALAAITLLGLRRRGSRGSATAHPTAHFLLTSGSALSCRNAHATPKLPGDC